MSIVQGTAVSLQVEINPLDNAIESVDNKNKEILFLVTNCNENVSFNLSSLIMVLSGAIDAAVNGGTEEYRTVFLSADYLRTHPDHEAITKKLRKTLEGDSLIFSGYVRP